jgi:hypothetical protein
MADRRQVLRLMLLGGSGLAVPAGLAAACGVPTGGHAIVDEPGPSAGTRDQSTEGVPPEPSSAVDARDLVQKYLLAAAGPLDEDNYLSRLETSAKRYLTDAFAAKWSQSPKTQVLVVRATVSPNLRFSNENRTSVDVTLQQMGPLNPTGTVTVAVPPLPAVQLTFEVVNNQHGPGFRIDDIYTKDGKNRNFANSLLLRDEALGNSDLNLFATQMVYYWPTAGKDSLVPDLRYVPLAGGAPKAYTRIIDDLVAPPSTWLQASAWPASVKRVASVYQGKDENWVVNLSTAPPGSLDQLMTQIRWSLWPLYRPTVQLQINSQPSRIDGTGTSFLKWNLADASGRNSDVFCIMNGVVQPLYQDTTTTPAVLNSPAKNTGVRWAGLSRDRSLAALVRSDGLWISKAGWGTYRQVTGLPKPASLGRPVWLPGQGQPRLLIIGGNALYAVDIDSLQAVEVTPSGVQSGVTAFSVAPDGHRIALIVDNAVSVAALSVGSDGPSIGVTTHFPVPGLVPSSMSAIAWSRMERVVVAGQLEGATDAYSAVEITIDGAYAYPLTTVNLTDPITHLVAFPPPPSVTATAMGRVYGQAMPRNRSQYPIEYQQVAQRLEPLHTTPAPATSGSSAAPAAAPLALFFAD